jgi:hypothetical protein
MDGLEEQVRYCSSCAELARINWTGDIAECTPAVWTEHHNLCRGCGRRFRLSHTAMELAKEDEPDATEEDLAGGFEFCLGCAAGESVPGEYDVEFSLDSRFVMELAEIAERHSPGSAGLLLDKVQQYVFEAGRRDGMDSRSHRFWVRMHRQLFHLYVTSPADYHDN